MKATSVDLHNLCLTLNQEDFGARLRSICDFFLSTEYGSWADGSNYETLDDFNYVLDKLDCVTFVEVALAAAKTQPRADFVRFCHEFENLLCKIHYANGVPNFISRNHFMCLDWLRNNKFMVEDITPSLFKQAKTAAAEIDKSSWYARHKINQNPHALLPENIAASLTKETAYITYIETDQFLQARNFMYEQFPEVCIVNIVRPNWDLTVQIGTHLNISHLGFVFKAPSAQDLIFYHASSEAKEVVNTSLFNYMQQTKQIPSIGGLNVQVISPGYFHAR